MISIGRVVPGVRVALQFLLHGSVLRPGLASCDLVVELVSCDCADSMSLASALDVVSFVMLKSGVKQCTATSPEAQKIISTRLAYTGLS